MKFNIIGAGRLGINIAAALSTHQIAALNCVFNRDLSSGERACMVIGSGTAVNTIEELTAAHVLWITSNDDAIRPLTQILAKHRIVKPETIVIHCSGVLNSTLLAPLRDQGCYVASFHPLKAFRSGYLNAHAFNNVFCVLEGDEKACTWITQSFKPLGADIISLLPEAKAAYHAAACIASNYLITLASCSEQLLLKAGITTEKSREIITNLMQGNLDNLQETESIADALTGPLARGDEDTLSLHLNAIDNPVVKKLYAAAGLATLPLTQLSTNKKINIEQLLSPGWC